MASIVCVSHMTLINEPITTAIVSTQRLVRSMDLFERVTTVTHKQQSLNESTGNEMFKAKSHCIMLLDNV